MISSIFYDLFRFIWLILYSAIIILLIPFFIIEWAYKEAGFLPDDDI